MVIQESQKDTKKVDGLDKENKERKIFADYENMLSEWDEIDQFTLWREVVEKFENDPRFRAIISESQRRKLFEIYVDQKERKKREQFAEQRRKNIEEYKKILNAADYLTSTYPWSEFKKKMEDNPVFNALDKLDRLDIYISHIKHLERQEDYEYRKKRSELRVKSRKARQAFRALLADLYHEGKITRKSKWSELLPEIKNDERYIELLSCSGSTPGELFYDFVEDLGIKFKKDKDKIRDIMKDVGISMTPTLTYEEWHEKVKEHPDFGSLKIASMESMFNELKERSIGKENKRKRRAERRFMEFLEEKINRLDTTWKDISPQVPPIEAFNLLSEEERENIFNIFMQEMKEKVDSDEEEGAIIDIKPKKKRSRKRKDDDYSDDESRSRSISRSRSPKRPKREEDLEEGEILD